MKGTVRQKKIKKKEKRKMGQDRKVRIALGQMKVVQGDTKENLRKMMEMIDQAADRMWILSASRSWRTQAISLSRKSFRNWLSRLTDLLSRQ